ncbi:prolyl 4-hydroxylase subunit alpha-1-like [Babylonia areolata]|uniref:prolyl 4-hydroxylase subunit alpha-1-like n=1 Tax=Babylonia areolata TaxID=304850 RepID=UPI003FCFAACC
MFVSLVGVLCFALCCVERHADGAETHHHMFTSYANLLKLYYMEEESLSNVDLFLREELLKHQDEASVDAAHNLTSVRKLLEEAKKTHREVGPAVKEYLAHPVNVFHLTQRLHYHWKEAIDLIRNSKACREWHMPYVISRLSNIEENLPSAEDMKSVAYSLLTIQHTQGIRTSDLLKGRVGQHASVDPLTLQQQFQIVKLAVEEDDYFYAAQWLKHLSKSPQLKDMKREEDGFNATNVLGMLASAYFRVNMMPEALKATEDLLKTDPDNMVARANRVFFEERVKREKRDSPSRPVRYAKEDVYRRKFETLCRGTSIKPSRLKCHLVPAWPRSKMAFFRMEVLKRKPPILAFHDVISPKDAALVVNVSNREYEKAAMDSSDGFRTPDFTLVLSKVGPENRTRKGREAHEQYQKTLQRIRFRLSSLPYTATMPFVAGESEARNFGQQGFYVKPRPEFTIHTMGGHTGTTLMFLNGVAMGGEIVFPSANTRVEPRVGTVVYYYPSMKKFHTVCPVAYGTEWVLVRSNYEKRASDWCRPHEDPDLY